MAFDVSRIAEIARSRTIGPTPSGSGSEGPLLAFAEGRSVKSQTRSARLLASLAAIAIGSMVALTLISCTAASSEIELIVTAVPPRLKAGSEGLIEVRLVTEGAFPQATLSAIASSPGVTILPSSLTIPAMPPRPTSTVANSPPNPPALGVIPIRTFRIAAAQAGDVTVVVRLAYATGEVGRLVAIKVDP